MSPNIDLNYTSIYTAKYLVSEREGLLFAEIELLGVVVNYLRLRKPARLLKENRKIEQNYEVYFLAASITRHELELLELPWHKLSLVHQT